MYGAGARSATRSLYPKFIPDSQYGFRTKCGTQDYGVSLGSKLHEALEANLEAILIALDVAGAFDKVWWAALLANLEHCGMAGKCLKLMKSYLCARFLCVVANGITSETLEFFCGVPQGAIWSPKFWNFHMRELPQCLSHTESFNYADDSALLKVFGHNSAVWSVDHFSRQALERHQALTEVNADLSSLIDFGKKWKVEFEPTKTHAMLVSNTNDYCFPCMSQLVFGAAHIKFEEELTLVGFVFDKKLTWKPMLNKVCSKGRQALGAMFRLKSLLGCSDLAILFKAFVRSTLEYGNLEYFAAAPGYLQRLDRIQATAERLCGHSFTALGDRRKAAAFGLICKLLDGECIGQLQQMCPVLVVEKREHFDNTKTRSQHSVSEMGARIDSKFRPRLDNYKRSFAAQMGAVFGELPASVVEIGLEKGWRAAMKPGQRFLAPNLQASKLKAGEYFVEKIVGVEESDVGRKYKVRWQGYPGQDSWEREVNVTGARAAVEEFWIALGEPMPESEVFRKNKRWKQKIVVDKKAAKRHKSELQNDLIFRG